MVVADPDMPDAVFHIRTELRQAVGRGQGNRLARTVRVEDGRLRIATAIDFDESLVLRVEVGKQGVADGKAGWRSAGTAGLEAQHAVGAVRVMVEQLFDGFQGAHALVAGHVQALQRVGGDGGVARADFIPGQGAVAIAIEADGEIEVAQGDVPLPVDLLAMHGQAQVTVAGLVGLRGREPQPQEQRHGKQAQFHRVPAFLLKLIFCPSCGPSCLTRRCRATSSTPLAAIQASTGCAAA